MSSKGSGSGDGHWVTINGNHVFIEDSSNGGDGSKDSGGTVLKGRVEKTGYPPNGDGNPDEGGDGGSVWGGIAGVLVAVAKTAIQVLASIAQAKAIEAQNFEKSGYGKPVNISHSKIDSYPEIQQNKSHIRYC